MHTATPTFNALSPPQPSCTPDRETGPLHRIPAPPADRDRWAGRWTFVLAAIGSAVGLGNFWRFPYLVYRYGGGTFLVPYVVLLLVVGIPMLQLELSLGQRMQSGDVSAFGRIHARLRGIGLLSIMSSFLVLGYYSVVLAWTALFLVESFEADEPWRKWNGSDAADAGAVVNGEPCADRALWHFYHEVLGLLHANCSTVVPDGESPHSMSQDTSQSSQQISALAVVWVIVLLSVLYGVRTAGWVVRVTMPLPFALAAVLFFRAITLDGARDGIDAYLGEWDWSQMREPKMWTDAAGQTFFTLSVCFGVMTSYGSYRPRDTPIVANVFIVAITNALFSFFCGFIVFGFIGYMAHEKRSECEAALPNGTANATQCAVSIQDVASSSIPLVFIVFPTALRTMGSASHFMSVVTFLTLFTLGWDSAFSILEAMTTVVLDTEINGRPIRSVLDGAAGRRVATPVVTIATSAAGFALGILFTSDVGLYWLDLVDHYVFSYLVLIDGVLQAVAVGWVLGYPAAAGKVGGKSAKAFMCGSGVAAAVLVSVVSAAAVSLAPCEQQNDGKEQCYSGGEVPIGFASSAAVLLAAWCYSYVVSDSGSVAEWFRAVSAAGSQDMMDFVETRGTGLPGSRASQFFTALWRVWWCVSVQYITPALLTFLVVLTFKKDVDERYAGYQTWMQNVGWLVVGAGLLLFVLPFLPCFEGGFTRDRRINAEASMSEMPERKSSQLSATQPLDAPAQPRPSPTHSHDGPHSPHPQSPPRAHAPGMKYEALV